MNFLVITLLYSILVICVYLLTSLTIYLYKCRKYVIRFSHPFDANNLAFFIKYPDLFNGLSNKHSYKIPKVFLGWKNGKFWTIKFYNKC